MKRCEFCGKPLVRKRYANNAREGPKKYAARKYCGLKCANDHRYYTSAKAAVAYSFSEDGTVGYGRFDSGETFLFDVADYDFIKSKNWRLHCQWQKSYPYVYDTGLRRPLHRYLLGIGRGLEADHINLNTLDNRRENLRLCTHRQNQCNQPPQANNTSGVPGVSFYPPRGKYRARIKHYGYDLHLGYYTTFLEAVQARNEGMKWLFGEFGRYSEAPEAPAHIKQSVKERCGRLLAGAAASVGGSDHG
jgi:hypothetical protein